MRATSATVLISTAHPDDETFGCGGTIALLARRGVAVYVLLATSGQAGEIAVAALDTSANRADLGALRESETRAATTVLGVAGVRFLGFRDGRLEQVGDEPLAWEVAVAIRELQPDVLITFGPDGIYGHPDHLAIHRATRLAWQVAADPQADVAGWPAHRVSRLFYQVIPAEVAERMNAERGAINLDGKIHFRVGYPASEITTRVDATEVREVKLEAMARHRSQTGNRMDQLRAWYQRQPLVETYVLAERRVPDHPGLASDLLAGL